MAPAKISGGDGILSLRKRSKLVEKKIEKLDKQSGKALTFYSLSHIVIILLRWERYITTVLVIVSTISSLGSLIYSGFVPNGNLGWKEVIAILAFSYSSIAWNLLFYLLLLPLLVKAIEQPLTTAVETEGPS